MKWVALAGSIARTTDAVEAAVRETTREIITRGDGIISGGAIGVDYFALDEAFRLDPTASRIRLFLPCSRETYRDFWYTKVREGLIQEVAVGKLDSLLESIDRANPTAIKVCSDKPLDTPHIFMDITEEILAAEELIAFHVNHSEGTQNTIDKAIGKGIPVKIFEYSL